MLRPCSECGRYTPDNAEICVHCGKQAGAKAPAAETAVSAGMPPPPPPPAPVAGSAALAVAPASPVPQMASVYCRHCQNVVSVAPGAAVCPDCGLEFAAEGAARLPANLGNLVAQSGRLTLISAAVALVVSAVLYVGLRPFSTPGSWLERLLFPAGGMQEVPWATVYVFLWGLAFLVMRLRLIRVERDAVLLPFSQELVHDLKHLGPETVEKALNEASSERHPGLFLHRATRVLNEWMRTGDTEAVNRVLNDQATLDSDTLQSSISIVRVFIWAAPILGFIGTVLGISVGVDNFSRFLGSAAGEQLQMQGIQSALVKVASSLAFAFNTTLLGLVAALLLMIAYTWIQRTEDDLLDRVYDAVRDQIIALLPIGEIDTRVSRSRRAPGISDEQLEAANGLAAAIQTAIEELGDRGDRFTAEAEALNLAANSLGAIQERQQALLGLLGQLAADGAARAQRDQELAARMDQASNQWAQNLQVACQTIATGLQEQRSEVISGVEGVARAFETRAEQQAQLLQRVEATAGEWPTQLREAAQAIAASLQRQQSEVVAEMARSDERLASSMTEAFTGAANGWEACLRGFGQELAGVFAGSCTELQEALRRDQALASDRVAQSYDRSTAAVATSVTDAIGELRQTVQQVGTALQALQNPYEIRLVPRVSGGDTENTV